MNKFTTNPSVQDKNLFEFIGTTPYGREETTAGSCPTNTTQGKFWGWGSQTCTYGGQWFDPFGGGYHDYYNCCKKHYVFWIVDETDCYVWY